MKDTNKVNKMRAKCNGLDNTNLLKILYLVPSLTPCGPINVVYNILRHLDRKRFKPVVVCLSDAGYRCNQADFEALGVEVRNLHLSKWYLQWHVRKVARKIEALYPDKRAVMHAHGYYPTLILAAMKGRKTLTTIHNICDEDFVMQKGWALGSYMATVYKRSLKKLTCCVTICNSMKQYYVSKTGGDIKCMKVVYNGVEPIAKEYDAVALRKELNIPEDYKVLLYPAILKKGKNHIYLEKELLNATNGKWVLLLAGDGPLKSACVKVAGGDRRIRLLGYRSDIDRLLSVTDFLVSPSVSEGLPMAVLEALMDGVPCLLSAIPPHREIAVQIFGNEAMIFDETQHGALTALFDRVVTQDFDHSLISRRANAVYSAEVMARGYERVYSQLD